MAGSGVKGSVLDIMAGFYDTVGGLNCMIYT
jgi:hypothetical protein